LTTLIESHKEDDDVVANQSRQLLEKTSVKVSYPIYQKINNYISKKYPYSKFLGEEKVKEIDHIFSLGIDQAEKELENLILFEEKKPRKDRMINLGKIANEFLKSPIYPDIRAVTLQQTINKVIGFRDKRTKEKYLKCIQQYIGKTANELGLVNVTDFVERIPNEYLNATTSSSSSFAGVK